MTKVDLEEAINEKRDEMIKIGMTKGLCCEETVLCSQELDKLLNDYRRLTSNKRMSNSTFLLNDLVTLIQNLLRFFSRPYKFLP
ncbi:MULTISPECIES: aspartyl-phosphate phosphatase Spo0E family protein [Bacillaceae]|uniref:aspartyl-phosphate phosphatase Spo0E family protein n=1 Tax=Bacillaceae TaxID=186817 RepID=UPI00088E50CC|nr:aspartyl-phosphate phosphatase Spo0E family protein [Bacillus sp. OK048]SDM36745.1 Spo0E like sporulation regulatory protein [Bacillus sp. OK048]